MKKGFTLLELLAVVVVLAIIALVITPYITRAIGEAKKGAAEESAIGIINAAEVYCGVEIAKNYAFNGATFTYDNETVAKDPLTATDFKFKGIKPTSGKVSINKSCIVTVENLKFGEYYANGGNKVSISIQKNETPIIVELVPNLIETLIDRPLVTGTTSGLHQDAVDENEYFFYGTINDNFLWYGGHEWRIVSFNTATNLITLISQQPLTAISWGSHLTPTNNCIYYKSCASLETSYIGNWLGEGPNGVFLKSLQGSTLYSKIVSTNYTRNIYNNLIQPTETNVKARLLTAEEYTRAGGRNSYLDIKDAQWLADIYNNSSVSNIDYDGNIYYSYAIGAGGIRPVISVSNLAISSTSEGLQNNQYLVENDTRATSLADVNVGDYIEVPCTGTICSSDNNWIIRVVNKEATKVKVILNGVLPGLNVFDSANPVFCGTSTINTGSLVPFIMTLPSTIIVSANSEFNIGLYTSGMNYADVSSTKYNGNVGLPVVGEMFSGNDIDINGANNKSFVIDSESIIENPKVANYVWLMNAGGSESVRIIGTSGTAGSDGPGPVYGARAVRPTFFLKSEVTIESGDGSPMNPYQVNTD